MPRSTPFYIAVILSCVTAVGAFEPSWIGYRGNGSGVFTDVKPPTVINPAKDLRWSAVLPSWSHGSPIVVDGRVYCTVESQDCFASDPDTCIWPQLVCVDLATGAQLWTAVLDPTVPASANGADAQELTSAWRAIMLYTSYHNLGRSEWFKPGQGGKALLPMLEAAGVDIAQKAPPIPKMLAKHGLFPETWHETHLKRGVDAIGQAYATPVSDGTTIYTATAQGHYAAFNKEGKRLWEAHYPGSLDSWQKFELAGRSPIIYKDLLLSDLMEHVRAIDRRTGKLAWTHHIGGSTYAAPDILTVDGKDVLWAGGKAFLLPEGKPLKLDGWTTAGVQILVKYDERDVAFFCGKGEHCAWPGKGNEAPFPPAAVRFSLTDGGATLKGTVLWHGINGKPAGNNAPWMTYHSGRLIQPGGQAYEALTGKAMGGKYPDTRQFLFIANDTVYTFGKGGGDGMLALGTSTIDGNKASVTPLLSTDFVDTDIERAVIAHNHKTVSPQWDNKHAAYGSTFAFGPDCIVFRTITRLYCYGK